MVHVKREICMCVCMRTCLSSTLPSADSPYPMLVLTGPQCCGKRELAHRLCQELSEYFAYGSVSTFLYIFSQNIAFLI